MSSKDKNPYRLVEQRIPFLERVTMAIQVTMASLALGITAILLLPVNFFRVLLTSTRQVLEVDMTNQLLPPPFPPSLNPDDDEDWKRAHREEYGE